MTEAFVRRASTVSGTAAGRGLEEHLSPTAVGAAVLRRLRRDRTDVGDADERPREALLAHGTRLSGIHRLARGDVDLGPLAALRLVEEAKPVAALMVW